MMFNPVRRVDAGVRLQPLKSQVRPFIIPSDALENPALRPVELVRFNRLSSLQTSRSRVFARREEKLPTVLQDGLYSAVIHNSRPLQTTRSEPVVRRNVQYPDIPGTILSARHGRSTAKQSTKVIDVAGVTSKDYGLHPVKTSESHLASGWAEIRVAQTIPNLRNYQELDVTEKHTESHSNSHKEAETKIISKTDTNKQEKKAVGQESLTDIQAKLEATKNASASGGSPVKGSGSISKSRNHGKITKMSSGYGSMSSYSQNGENVSGEQDLKNKELNGIYKSTVTVVDNSKAVVAQPQTEEHILTEKETNIYKHLKYAYQESIRSDKELRKKRFIEKFQEITNLAAVQREQAAAEMEAKKELKRKKQFEQLKNIREKYEDERMKRFKTSYISKNFEIYDRLDRSKYGLPAHFLSNENIEKKVTGKRGIKVAAIAFVRRQVKIKKNSIKVFQDNKNIPNIKDPKMEGKDQMTILVSDAEGKPQKAVKLDVKKELETAGKLIETVTDETKDDLFIFDDSKNVNSNFNNIRQQPKDKPSGKTSELTSNSQGEKSARNDNTKKFTTRADNKSKNFIGFKTENIKSSVKASNEQMNNQVGHASPPKIKPIREVPVSSSLNTVQPSKRTSVTPPKRSAMLSIPIYNKEEDQISIGSMISVITEESQEGSDFYEQLMSKYGITLSDDEDL